MRFEQLRQRVERAEHRVTDRVDHAQSSGQSLLQAWRQAWTPGRIVVAGLLSGFLVGRGQPLSRMDGARWLQMASTMSSMFAVLRAAAMDAATPAEADAEVAQAAPAQTASPAPGPVQPPPAEAATEVSER